MFTISSAQATGPGTSTPGWFKYTVTYADLATAGLTNNITLFTLPAKGVIHNVMIKHSTAFSGSTIASYTLSLGITGTLAKYVAAFDVFQAVAAGTLSLGVVAGCESHTAGTAIKVAAVAIGANLNAATAGSADIWVNWSILP